MESDMVAVPCETETDPDELNSTCTESPKTDDTTIHPFNVFDVNNVTVIERDLETKMEISCVAETDLKIGPTPVESDAGEKSKLNSCEGSDSGVEVAETTDNCPLLRTLSANSEAVHDFKSITPTGSLDWYRSNSEETYGTSAKRYPIPYKNYKTKNSDVTSEGSSESSSITSARDLKWCSSTATGVKKKLTQSEKSKSQTTPISDPLRSTTPVRGRSQAKTIPRVNLFKSNPGTVRTKPTPDTINLNSVKKVLKKLAMKPNTTPISPSSITPTDDGRWPSVYSKPAPLLAKSSRTSDANKNILDKYATLPRRRKEKSADSIKDLQQKISREGSMTRSVILKKQAPTTTKALSPYPKKKYIVKTRIYHETCVQTALTAEDVEKALQGSVVKLANPSHAEKQDAEAQVDIDDQEAKRLREELEEHRKVLAETEVKLKEETAEKEELKEECRRNAEKISAILEGDGSGGVDDVGGDNPDSLLVLENRFQNASKVILDQAAEISDLTKQCRILQTKLDKSLAVQEKLLLQQRELQEETVELNEFMQAEKDALFETLKESENEVKLYKSVVRQKDKELENKEERCNALIRISEQIRQELREQKVKLEAIESRDRELLVHQGSNVSGAAVALSGLISRLNGLVEELVSSYSISQQELDDVIFHNEVYSNSSSSPEASPAKFKNVIMENSPSPKRGSSFISAVINAIKNATSQGNFSGERDISKETIYTEHSNSSELLDSETEPCLMMEHVLEDVTIPDGHSHNMISSGHSILSGSCLRHSESMNNSIHRHTSEHTSTFFTDGLNDSFASDSSSDLYGNVSLVDQVIDVDNLITRLLKVIRIIQLENDEVMNELQEERDGYCQQVDRQKETSKHVTKQMNDWETVAAQLKTEVDRLTQQVDEKHGELEALRCELNDQRDINEKLNRDVCDLSTALSKSELVSRMKDDEATEALNVWKIKGDMPPNEILGRILVAQTEIDVLKKEKNIME